MCFVDFQKAFDTLKHEKMIKALKDINIDGKNIRLITNLYWNQRASVCFEDKKSDWIEIKKGVQQGCVMSADFFSLYGQIVINELEDMEGLIIGGKNINNIRYAEDTVLIADSMVKYMVNNALRMRNMDTDSRN